MSNVSPMIASMCVCDKEFPSILWDKIIQQSQDTSNMLRTSCDHPRLSAFHVLEGQHDYNRVLFGPPGTRATIFNPSELRISWGLQTLDAWYTGPALLHYRCMNFHVPSTGGHRTSAHYKLHPTHIKVPQETPMIGQSALPWPLQGQSMTSPRRLLCRRGTMDLHWKGWQA